MEPVRQTEFVDWSFGAWSACGFSGSIVVAFFLCGASTSPVAAYDIGSSQVNSNPQSFSVALFPVPNQGQVSMGVRARSVGDIGIDNRGSVRGPTVSELSISGVDSARVAGTCAPSLDVLVDLDGGSRRSVTCDRFGRFQVRIEDAFGAGDHTVATSVRLRSGFELSGQDVRVFIPVHYQGGALIDPGVVFARADTDKSNRVPHSRAAANVSRGLRVADSENTGGREEGVSSGAGSERADDGENNAAGSSRQFIHDQATQAASRVSDWVGHSKTTYYGEVVSKLSQGGGFGANTEIPGRANQTGMPLPERHDRAFGDDEISFDLRSYFYDVRDWLENAHGRYQRRVVRPLSLPGPVDGDIQVADEGRVIVASPGGRLATSKQIADSQAVSSSERSRLTREWAQGGGRPADLADEERGKKSSASSSDPDFERLSIDDTEDRKRLDELLARSDEEQRLQRERLEQQRLEAIRVAEAERLKALEEERKAALLRSAQLEAKAKAEAERKRVAALAARKLRAAEVAQQRLALQGDTEGSVEEIVVPSRKPTQRSLGANVAVPVRAPLRPAREFQPDSKSALGARAVAVRSSQTKSRRAKSRGATSRRAKSRRVRKSSKHRRAAVASYRKRKARSKKRRVRRRSGARTYMVRRGDTLWDIARRHYGSGERYRIIARANRCKISNPHKIYPRQRLRLPKSRR